MRMMMNTGLKPVWAGSYLRLDPTRLPQAASYAASDGPGDVSFTLHKSGVVMRRVLGRSGLPVSMVLPTNAFRGVAAQAIDEGNGKISVTLELLHTDRALSVPLLVAEDLEDVAADWQAWAKAYNLPMLLFEADGEARSLEETLNGNAPNSSVARRKSRHQKRRPRFLARRKTGHLGLRLVVDGRELIARR